MPTANFDMRRILHGEQEFELLKPILVGDMLTGTAKVADVYEKEGGRGGKMTFMVTEIEYKNQKGEKVAIARSNADRNRAGGRRLSMAAWTADMRGRAGVDRIMTVEIRCRSQGWRHDSRQSRSRASRVRISCAMRARRATSSRCITIRPSSRPPESRPSSPRGCGRRDALAVLTDYAGAGRCAASRCASHARYGPAIRSPAAAR